MNLSTSRSTGKNLSFSLGKIQPRSGLLFGLIILSALLAFELFNYSTTDYALRDLLGELRFAGLRWSTILSLAFCGIDFAGIARLFTPQQGTEEPKEIWYLMGAWLLAATMNALLTWWGVSMAIVNHAMSSTAIIDPETLTTVVPIFVSLMVWIIRILVIGTLSASGEKIFSNAVKSPPANTVYQNQRPARASSPANTPSVFANNASLSAQGRQSQRPEPTYHSMQARPAPRPIPQPDKGTDNQNYRM